VTIRDEEIQTQKCFQYFNILEKIRGKRCIAVELLVKGDNKLRMKERNGK